MGANRELTITERSQIIGLFKGGHKRSDIGKILGFKVDTVKKTIQRYGASEMPVSKKRSGRPKLLGENEKKVLKEIVTNDNRAPAKNIKESFYQSTGLNVSTKTICRNLHQLVSILIMLLQNHFLMINNAKIDLNGA
jgi:transposase